MIRISGEVEYDEYGLKYIGHVGYNGYLDWYGKRDLLLQDWYNYLAVL